MESTGALTVRPLPKKAKAVESPTSEDAVGEGVAFDPAAVPGAIEEPKSCDLCQRTKRACYRVPTLRRCTWCSHSRKKCECECGFYRIVCCSIFLTWIVDPPVVVSDPSPERRATRSSVPKSVGGRDKGKGRVEPTPGGSGERKGRLKAEVEILYCSPATLTEYQQVPSPSRVERSRSGGRDDVLVFPKLKSKRSIEIKGMMLKGWDSVVAHGKYEDETALAEERCERQRARSRGSKSRATTPPESGEDDGTGDDSDYEEEVVSTKKKGKARRG